MLLGNGYAIVYEWLTAVVACVCVCVYKSKKDSKRENMFNVPAKCDYRVVAFSIYIYYASVMLAFVCFLGEDATEESEENPFITASLVPEHEHLYVDDPKKALKGFYEREGTQYTV